jgi:hypothetical protein
MSEEKKHYCSKCSKEFKTRAGLKKHEKTKAHINFGQVKPAPVKKEKKKEDQCIICDNIINKSNALEHYAEHKNKAMENKQST